MKHFPLESAFLATLVVVTGCGESASPEFVDFKQTAPSDLDRELQKPAENSPETNGSVNVAPVSNSKESNPSKTASGSPSQQNNSTTESPGTDSSAVSGDAPNSANTKGNDVVAALPTPDSPVPAADSTKDPVANSADATGEKLIVSRQSGLTGPADAPGVDNTAEGEQREIQLLIPEKHFRKELGEAFRVSYDDLDLLKVLNMEPVPADAVSHFPSWLSSLDGKPIRIRGFMYPTFAATDLTEFILARDNGICCFVRKPKVYDIIGVTLADGEKTDYIEGRPFDVQGILRIDPAADDNNLSRLYRIEQAKVIH